MRPDEGRILLDDAILFDGATGVHLPPQARNCGYVFQNYALFPHMTLRENLEFAAERRPRLERHRRVNEMLERFRLTEAAGRRPHEVSGGQRQRCSIARALDRRAEAAAAGRTGARPGRAAAPGILRRSAPGPSGIQDSHVAGHPRSGGVFRARPKKCSWCAKGASCRAERRARFSIRPRTLDVARLLGAFNLLAGEIRTLDPGRKTSRVQMGEFEIGWPVLSRAV